MTRRDRERRIFRSALILILAMAAVLFLANVEKVSVMLSHVPLFAGRP